MFVLVLNLRLILLACPPNPEELIKFSLRYNYHENVMIIMILSEGCPLSHVSDSLGAARASINADGACVASLHSSNTARGALNGREVRKHSIDSPFKTFGGPIFLCEGPTRDDAKSGYTQLKVFNSHTLQILTDQRVCKSITVSIN